MADSISSPDAAPPRSSPSPSPHSASPRTSSWGRKLVLFFFLLLLIPLTFHGGYTANNALVKAELFPAHIRSLGVALPYSIGNTIFAGTVEIVALEFKDLGFESGFYWYVALIVAVELIAILMLPETRDTSLIQED